MAARNARVDETILIGFPFSCWEAPQRGQAKPENFRLRPRPRCGIVLHEQRNLTCTVDSQLATFRKGGKGHPSRRPRSVVLFRLRFCEGPSVIYNSDCTAAVEGPAGRSSGLPLFLDVRGYQAEQLVFLVGFAKVLVDSQFEGVLTVFVGGS